MEIRRQFFQSITTTMNLIPQKTAGGNQNSRGVKTTEFISHQLDSCKILILSSDVIFSAEVCPVLRCLMFSLELFHFCNAYFFQTHLCFKKKR